MTTGARTVVVTGGRRGLGRILALHLSARGYAVHLVGRAAHDELDPELRRAVTACHRADLADVAALDTVLRTFEERNLAIDVLVSVAGVRASGRTCAETCPDDLRSMIHVNLVAPVLMARALAPGMVRRGYGRIILLGSRAGFRGAAGEAVYGASKAGIVSLTESLSRELGHLGVTVNTICPEMFSTPGGDVTASGTRIVARVVAAVDRLLDGTARGRIIPIVSWRHRLVDVRRQLARALAMLLSQD